MGRFQPVRSGWKADITAYPEGRLYLRLEMRHSFRMPIAEFSNRREAPLVLVVEPSGEEHEIPYRSSAAIRYALREGAEDRSCCEFSEGRIRFWCNPDGYEIEVQHPSPMDNLLWDMCVNGGWCGGIVDGKPTYVTDLIPMTGMLTAQEFAKLAVRADGWPDAEPMPDRHLRWLEAKFIEHCKAEAVSCEVLHQLSARPFDDA